MSYIMIGPLSKKVMGLKSEKAQISNSLTFQGYNNPLSERVKPRGGPVNNGYCSCHVFAKKGDRENPIRHPFTFS